MKKDRETKYIDIAKIINESDSKFLKKLPGCVIRLFALIIKQKEINRILEKYKDSVGSAFLEKMFDEFNLKLEVEGMDNLPENGKCFFAANHPFGVIDGLIITRLVHQKYGDLKAIGNDAFMFIPQLRPLIAAVNVFGRSPKEYLNELEKTFNSNVPITHFPAGEVSRLYNGRVQDSAWQKSFISRSISSKRHIVPIYFYGKNSKLFYAINRLRKILGIKMNLELILLPREMFKKRNKTIKIKIGKPISYTMFDNSFSHWEWAQKLRSGLYEMANKKYKEI